jgi:hypothetical protein
MLCEERRMVKVGQSAVRSVCYYSFYIRRVLKRITVAKREYNNAKIGDMHSPAIKPTKSVNRVAKSAKIKVK